GLAALQRVERRAPSRRKRVDAQRALQSIARMSGRIQERVDLDDRHPLLRLGHLHDLVAGAHLAFTQHAHVETRTSTRCQQRRHARLVRPNAEAIAGDPRLRDFEQRAADQIPIADAHHVVGQSVDREVLAELSVDEVAPLQLLLPMAVRFDLVDVDRALLTSVSAQIALTVSVEIQSPNATTPAHRIFPDRRVNGAPLPRDVAWKPDVHREESRHVTVYLRGRISSTLSSRSGPCGITV